MEFKITFTPDQSIENNGDAFAVMNHFKVICNLAEHSFTHEVQKMGGMCEKSRDNHYFLDTEEETAQDEPERMQTWQEQFEADWYSSRALGAELNFLIFDLNPPLVSSLIQTFEGYFSGLGLNITAEGRIKK